MPEISGEYGFFEIAFDHFPAGDRHEANLFFPLVSARYEKGYIVLTSDKHLRDWPEIFAGDEILATAT